MKLTITIILLSLLLGACTSTGLALLNANARIGANHNISSDIAYGEKAWQKLDLHIPPDNNKNRPTLIFFYGGSWDSGKKEQYFFAANAFAKLGYLVVVPDYVKYPNGKFPDFIKDGALALAWVKKNIGQYGGDSSTIFVVGHSAGAHLGALMLADRTYLDEVDLHPNDVRAFAGLAGPYNFTPKSPKLVQVFGPAENYSKMKVMNHIDGDEPPMLFAHGSKDKTVGVANKDTTIAAIKRVGGKYQDIDYPNVSHVGLLLSLTSPFNNKAMPSKDIDRFFQRHLASD